MYMYVQIFDYHMVLARKEKYAMLNKLIGSLLCGIDRIYFFSPSYALSTINAMSSHFRYGN
jgi:hypothetical protein